MSPIPILVHKITVCAMVKKPRDRQRSVREQDWEIQRGRQSSLFAGISAVDFGAGR
jgi:hypothetical protein